MQIHPVYVRCSSQGGVTVSGTGFFVFGVRQQLPLFGSLFGIGPFSYSPGGMNLAYVFTLSAVTTKT